MNKTKWFEAYSKYELQRMVDDFCEAYKVISISITETEGPQHYLAVVLYRDYLDQALEDLDQALEEQL